MRLYRFSYNIIVDYYYNLITIAIYWYFNERRNGKYIFIRFFFSVI